jgi:hypothetical protein
MRTLTHRLAPAVLLLALLAVPATAGSKLVVGISDQNASTFSDPLYAAAKLSIARYVVPFDVTRDPAQAERFDGWLTAARAARQKTLVSFEHSRRSRAAAGRLPSPSAYKKAITAFKKRYGSKVTDISPWNEVDRKYVASRGEGQPTWNKPAAAARFYGIARKVFKGRHIVALDVLDQANVNYALKYIRRFRTAVRKQHLPAPKIWGLHPYSDINRFSTTRTRKMLKATGKGQVWLTEASGIVQFGGGFPFSETRAAAANRCMFTIAKLSKRIKRLYVFGWGAGGSFDSGLIGADGTPRPGYTVVQKRKAGRCKKP